MAIPRGSISSVTVCCPRIETFMQPAARRYSEAEYAELEEKAPFKSEFFQGEIFAMAGGTMPHANWPRRWPPRFAPRLTGAAAGS